ncbi:hypothetical protein LINGRAHAP2_LOCUS24306 [Linum grandiflorum]
MWIDASGVRIQGDSPRNFAVALQELITVGSVYKITGFLFRSLRPSFRTCRFPRWLDLSSATRFELQAPPSVSFEPESFEFVPMPHFPARMHPCAYLTGTYCFYSQFAFLASLLLTTLNILLINQISMRVQ